jgi:hypothetical protein
MSPTLSGKSNPVLWSSVALGVACVREQSDLSASIAVYRPQAKFSGGRFDGKFGVRREEFQNCQLFGRAGDN